MRDRLLSVSMIQVTLKVYILSNEGSRLPSRKLTRARTVLFLPPASAR